LPLKGSKELYNSAQILINTAHASSSKQTL